MPLELTRRLRGLGISLVVLTLSAGAVLAGGSLPEQASHGLETAGEAAGKTVPVRPSAEEPAADEESEEAEEPAETPEEEADADGSSDNHGALVSAAAQMETPEGFRNHGAFVSCVAHMKDGTLATVDLEALTPEDCEAAAKNPNAAAGKAKGAEKRAEKAAAKAARKAGDS